MTGSSPPLQTPTGQRRSPFTGRAQVVGRLTAPNGRHGSLDGCFALQRFKRDERGLMAVGWLSGRLLDESETPFATASTTVAIRVDLASTSDGIRIIVPEFEVVLMGLTTVVTTFELPIRRSPIGPGSTVTLLHPVP